MFKATVEIIKFAIFIMFIIWIIHPFFLDESTVQTIFIRDLDIIKETYEKFPEIYIFLDRLSACFAMLYIFKRLPEFLNKIFS